MSMRIFTRIIEDSSDLPLRSVAQGENELKHQEEDVAVLQEVVNNR